MNLHFLFLLQSVWSSSGCSQQERHITGEHRGREAGGHRQRYRADHKKEVSAEAAERISKAVNSLLKVDMARLDVTEMFHGISFPGHLHTQDSLKYAVNFPFLDTDILIASYPKSGKREQTSKDAHTQTPVFLYVMQLTRRAC